MEKRLKWNKYTIKTTTQATDLICGILIENDIEGIEIEDNLSLSKEDQEKMYINYVPELKDDGISFVTFYLEEKSDDTLILKKIKDEIEIIRAFTDPGEGSVVMSVTEEEEWIDKWKEFFKPFLVEDILIKPTWETTDIQAKIVIDIDPGTAFGTGLHETTQLCIKQMKKYLKPGARMMDIGCGSGILSIAGLKIGASGSLCIDIDPSVAPYVKDNMEGNHINTNQFDLLIGDILEDTSLQNQIEKETYDIIVANILADVIIPMGDIILPYLKKDGIIITSGIINTMEDKVKKMFEKSSGYKVLEITKQKDWVSITAKRV